MGKKNLTIDEMYAFVGIDPEDGSEGVLGMLDQRAGWWVALVGADMDRVNSLRPIAQQIADQRKAAVKLLHFTSREVLETIIPQ